MEQSRERSGTLPNTLVWQLLKREPSGCPRLQSPTTYLFTNVFIHFALFCLFVRFIIQINQSFFLFLLFLSFFFGLYLFYSSIDSTRSAFFFFFFLTYNSSSFVCFLCVCLFLLLSKSIFLSFFLPSFLSFFLSCPISFHRLSHSFVSLSSRLAVLHLFLCYWFFFVVIVVFNLFLTCFLSFFYLFFV